MTRSSFAWTASALIALAGCGGEPPPPSLETPDFSAVSRVDSGTAVSVMLSAYSTTLLADGMDHAPLRIAVTDSLGREIRSADHTIRIYVDGDGTITTPEGDPVPTVTDTAGVPYAPAPLVDGVAHLAFRAGTRPDRVDVSARSEGLFAAGHQIHTIPADVELRTPTTSQLAKTNRPVERMIGADISWLPQIESGDGLWADFPGFAKDGEPVDAIQLLRDHGFNTIRLRIFVEPANPEGYSPGVGFCGLDPTLEMARRVEEAGMDLLLDFHYSDYWADPQQQNKPLAWAELDYAALQDSMRAYTSSVLRALDAQGMLPEMVQIGNEVNHGLLWPDGHIGDLDGLAGLLRAGVEGVRAVDPDLPVMMHIALGGQNDEARFWLDNMIARGVEFDVLGLSFYSRWHGTLEDLHRNVHDLAARYRKPINVVEYGGYAREIADIVFSLPDGLGKGTAIWEPLGFRSGLFDRQGNVTDRIQVYDSLNAEYLRGPS
jgi:beta-galactosidase